MSDKTLNYKKTLNLPKTDFSMKANLKDKEPAILSQWEREEIYKLIKKKSKSKPKYILHDGPPYANGHIHIGHALNKILKDIIVKYKTMNGCDSPYLPGWDCHGLPVEHQLFKELGKNKYQIEQLEFRKKAKNYALKYVDIQKEEFKRLGVFGDWGSSYLTLSHSYESSIINSFLELQKKGFIYRGLKPVNWCYTCETALAEAEVEYENHTSPSIYVKFKVNNYQKISNLPENKDLFLLIWTTTPWTLLANVAVAAHPNFIYSLIETEKDILIIEKNLAPSVLEKCNIRNYKLIKEISGQELKGLDLDYSHPFDIKNSCAVVLADYVTRDEGTGLVHTAPGHGQEDYLTGLKYNLEIIMPVDSKGKFTNRAKEFLGMHVFDANKKIVESLNKKEILLFEEKVTHSYPHCWRCKNPIIFRATEQWFMKIDHDNLRNKVLNKINKEISWIPRSGRDRISTMVSSRPDWCLSRQRYWGVPIPSVSCNSCKRHFLFEGVIKNFAKVVLKEGTDAWFIYDIGHFLPKGLKCPNCKGKIFLKDTGDILDVWFDSGVSSQAVLKNNPNLKFPANLYLEGSDQHRGWFQSSLIPAMAIDKRSPFKAVLTHGFVVDAEGRKMSKSIGNVISPQDIIKDYGADILRLWVASSDYNEDVRISKEILDRLVEAYRKIRNTIRFLLGNLYDFNPDKNKINYDKLLDIDKWALYRLHRMLGAVRDAFEKEKIETFDFSKAYRQIYSFCNEELSSLYLDILKDRLYTFPTNSTARRSAQTVMYEILSVLVKIIAPILPFTAEEIFKSMPKDKDIRDIASVHLLAWPDSKQNSKWYNEKIDTMFRPIMEVRPSVLKALEEERARGLIGSSLEAKVLLSTTDREKYEHLNRLRKDLPAIFIISQIEINLVDKLENLGNNAFPISIKIQKAHGVKCLRCWNYSDTVGEDNIHSHICSRCIAAIKTSYKGKQSGCLISEIEK